MSNQSRGWSGGALVALFLIAALTAWWLSPVRADAPAITRSGECGE